TVVGDVAQTSARTSARSWSDRLDPILDRWELAELTVNYRTPGQVADLAAAVARAAGSVVGDLTSARDVPGSVRIHRAPAADLVGVAARAAEAAVEGAADASGEGRVAVIAPPALTGAVRQELSRGPAAQALPEGDADLRKPLNVLSPRDV